MEETIAELRRQLEEERQAREEAERRQEEEKQAREEAERRQEEERQAREDERKAREEAERHVQPNTLFTLLDRCHNSLSQAIRVEIDITLTTQGDATNLVNRLYPKRIVPWLDFPQL
jgi:sRNA-binding protein